jgi:hypothetical protein
VRKARGRHRKARGLLRGRRTWGHGAAGLVVDGCAGVQMTPFADVASREPKEFLSGVLLLSFV